MYIDPVENGLQCTIYRSINVGTVSTRLHWWKQYHVEWKRTKCCQGLWKLRAWSSNHSQFWKLAGEFALAPVGQPRTYSAVKKQFVSVALSFCFKATLRNIWSCKLLDQKSNLTVRKGASYENRIKPIFQYTCKKTWAPDFMCKPNVCFFVATNCNIKHVEKRHAV